MQNVQRTARWVGKRYRSEALRRRELRAQRKPLVRDARRAVAAAKALDPNGITSAVPTAERGLKSAQRRVPDAMPVFALKSAVGTAAAAYFGLPLVPGEVWAWGGAVRAPWRPALLWLPSCAASERPAGWSRPRRSASCSVGCSRSTGESTATSAA